MREDTVTHDWLPARNLAAGRGGDVLGHLSEALRREAQVDALHVLQGHYDLFERSVAGTLAEPADRRVDEACTGADPGEGVGGGHSEVVVRMHLDVEAGFLNQPL